MKVIDLSAVKLDKNRLAYGYKRLAAAEPAPPVAEGGFK